MYEGKKVSLVLPTYNEKDSIKKVIQDFEKLGVLDEIIVVNNNAVAGTSEEIKQTTAKEVFQPIQGYGAAIQKGLAETTGDLVAVCEPDETFFARDIFKLLVFSEEVDVVYGSRTVKNFIWGNAKMGLFLRWGNWFVAKLIEVLFNGNSLSDVSCTYRLIKRSALDKMLPTFMVKSNFFSPEMMVRGYLMGFKSIQIPVNYLERVGESTITSDFKKSFILGIKMIILIFAMRLGMEKSIIKFLEKNHA
jgi:glycosyltransferase involved in cell wall biosynthesis